MRDARADRSYFVEVMRRNVDGVEMGRQDAADDATRGTDPELYVSLVHIYCASAAPLTAASYSIGDPIDTVTQHAAELITAETGQAPIVIDRSSELFAE